MDYYKSNTLKNLMVNTLDFISYLRWIIVTIYVKFIPSENILTSSKIIKYKNLLNKFSEK